MQQPKRIQLRRTAGWRKPEGAVVVTRGSAAAGRLPTPTKATAPTQTTPIWCSSTAHILHGPSRLNW
ncbi:hypothetical protein LOKVESSMR4R_03735 [Yoonia vestfoldensis]|uniref:Uncharacterized protein n=1 Tax=Yoonia vestfoldensis TaxID=245188 RepID=A0A1Y0EHY6_9RHOB|nr:hypothetical protein LOKVESSMR4R_03735 [Yoonia vestfoldensis]